MTQICPTVTAFDTTTFQAQLALVSDFANRIHIDSMDGDFTPTHSPALEELSIATDKIIDLHVMYRRPQDKIDDIIALQPRLVIVHAESDADIPLFAATLRQHTIQTGIALLPDTPVADILYLLPHVQHVLVFGGRLGFHGGEADLRQLQKVPAIRAASRFIEVGWDGGANLDNIVQIKQAGVDVVNVGSCIHDAPDPKARYHELTELAA